MTLEIGPVHLQILDRYVLLSNGLVHVTLSKPGGMVTGIRYCGIDNLLETRNRESNRGYWDVNWSGQGGGQDTVEGTVFEVIVQNENLVELSFKKLWDKSQEVVPFNIDKRFIMLRNSQGFYSYALYERFSGWLAFTVRTTRLTFKLRQDKFHYMALADYRQRHLPLPEDRGPPRGQQLAYPEAVRLVNPIEPDLKGEVDDKYQYSCDNKDSQVHGWVSTDPAVGFWLITPSNEFRSGGPTKQNLTSHVGPTSLAVFWSSHYAGQDLSPFFGEDEGWKKVFGPVFIYVNTIFHTAADPRRLLWENAKLQALQEVQIWPYSFVSSPEYPKANQRGEVHGRLRVQDLETHSIR